MNIDTDSSSNIAQSTMHSAIKLFLTVGYNTDQVKYYEPFPFENGVGLIPK